MKIRKQKYCKILYWLVLSFNKYAIALKMEIVQTFLAFLKKAKIKVLLVFYLALSSGPLFKIQIGFGQKGHFLQEMKPIKKRYAIKDIRMEKCIEKGSNDILWNAVTTD